MPCTLQGLPYKGGLNCSSGADKQLAGQFRDSDFKSLAVRFQASDGHNVDWAAPKDRASEDEFKQNQEEHFSEVLFLE